VKSFLKKKLAARPSAKKAAKAMRTAVAHAHTVAGVKKGVKHIVIKPSKTKVALVGSVINYLNNGHVLNAKVIVKRGKKVVTRTKSNGNGHWAVMVKPGKYKVIVKAKGFIGIREKVTVKKGERTVTVVSGMSPTMKDNQVRFVLVWGDHPQDLDSHLILPEKKCTVIYYKKTCDNWGVAKLDLDATRGSGPETITIPTPKKGTYSYEVVQYSKDGSLAKSEAKVYVFTGKKVVTFRADKAAAGKGRNGKIQGTKWDVFQWVVDGDGKGKLKRY